MILHFASSIRAFRDGIQFVGEHLPHVLSVLFFIMIFSDSYFFVEWVSHIFLLGILYTVVAFVAVYLETRLDEAEGKIKF